MSDGGHWMDYGPDWPRAAARAPRRGCRWFRPRAFLLSMRLGSLALLATIALAGPVAHALVRPVHLQPRRETPAVRWTTRPAAPAPLRRCATSPRRRGAHRLCERLGYPTQPTTSAAR